MSAIGPNDCELLSSAYAFLGNTLLAPMTQTSSVGLNPEFWRAFPDFGDAELRGLADGMAAHVESRVSGEVGFDDVVQACAVEYTQLFVGPPHPAASPWESAYSDNGEAPKRGVVGFGEPTFEMRRLLREIGLEVRNENNQYEDHMGIELLYASELCRRCGQGDTPTADAGAYSLKVDDFIRKHPLAWIGRLVKRVGDFAPDGYFIRILNIAKRLMEVQIS